MQEKRLKEIIYKPDELLVQLGLKGKFRDAIPLYQPYSEENSGLEEGTIIGVRITIEE